LSHINCGPLLQPVRLEPDTVTSLPYAALSLGSDLTGITKTQVSARADFLAIEDVQIFVAATIATKNIKNRGSVHWTESSVV
jgi:hypothetical protein